MTHFQIVNLDQNPQDLLENQIKPLLAEDGQTCTIDNKSVTDRKSLIDTITSQHIGMTKEGNSHLLKFTYSTQIAHLIMDFIISEQECCTFFDFDLLFRKEQDMIVFRISSEKLSPDKLDQMIVTLIRS